MINLNQQAFLLDLKLGQLTLSRKVASTMVETDADPALLRISKKILDCPEMQAIKAHQRHIRGMIETLRLPTGDMFRPGMYLMPYSLLERTEDYLSKANEEMKGLIDTFLDVYTITIEQDKLALRSLFNEADYPPPTKIRTAFQMAYSYQTVATPESLKTFRFDIFKREEEKMRRMWEEAAAESQGALRQQALELARHAVEKLTPGEDGKPKTFKESMLGNWNEFIDLFQHKNITADSDLEGILNKVRNAIAGRKCSDIRSDASVAAEIKTLFEGVVGQLDGMVVARPTRRMNLEEE